MRIRQPGLSLEYNRGGSPRCFGLRPEPTQKRSRISSKTQVDALSGEPASRNWLICSRSPDWERASSSSIADATHMASLLGCLKEDERQASWGGSYTIYTSVTSSHRSCP